MDNVQKHNICINVASSQTFRSYNQVVRVWHDSVYNPLYQISSESKQYDRKQNMRTLHYVFMLYSSCIRPYQTEASSSPVMW
jgi:hypothetical protein